MKAGKDSFADFKLGINMQEIDNVKTLFLQTKMVPKLVPLFKENEMELADRKIKF